MSILFDTIFDISVTNVSRIRIVDALYDLVLQRSFADINISDICKQAGVSRQTFYRHFNSKYDTVNWLWEELSKRYMTNVGRDMSWHDSLVLLFSSVSDYLPFFCEAGKVDCRESINFFACETRKRLLRETITDCLGIPLTKEIEFQIGFFAAGEQNLIKTLAWRQDIVEFAVFLESCVPKPLYRLLNDGVTI